MKRFHRAPHRRMRTLALAVAIAILTMAVGTPAIGDEAESPLAAQEAPGAPGSDEPSPQHHDYPPDPLDPNFVPKMLGNTPPLGYTWHAWRSPHICVDLKFTASYSWLAATATFPTTALSVIESNTNCTSTQLSRVEHLATVRLTCGANTFTISNSSTGSNAPPVGQGWAQASVQTTHLACQPGVAGLQYTMQAALVRPNGTTNFYCMRAIGLLGSTISEQSWGAGQC